MDRKRAYPWIVRKPERSDLGAAAPIRYRVVENPQPDYWHIVWCTCVNERWTIYGPPNETFICIRCDRKMQSVRVDE